LVTFRIESTSRWDALALAQRLARYNWFLVEPDQRHWDVCVPVEQGSSRLPDDLRRTIEGWLRERRLERTIVHTGSDDRALRQQSDERETESIVNEELRAMRSAEPRPFFSSRRSTNEQVVVRLGGECDLASLEQLNAALEDAAAQESREVVVDLTEVTFVDSLTLGALVAAGERVRAYGGTFRVVGVVATEVRRAFEITGLDKHLLDASS
jgi:anti-sigma B factor antagonist